MRRRDRGDPTDALEVSRPPPERQGRKQPAGFQGDRRLALLVSVFLLSLYLLTTGAHTSSPDEESLYQVTRSLARRGRLDIPIELSATTSWLAPGPDGRLYAPYGIVPSVLQVPFYALGSVVAQAAAPRFGELIRRAGVTLLATVATAAAGGLLFLLARDLGWSREIGIALALCYGLGTFAWPYAKYAWSEPVTALALLASALGAFRATARGSVPSALAAGAALAVAIGTKLATVIVVPGWLLAVALPRPRTGGLRGGLSRAGALLGPLAVCALGISALNHARFGAALETGYQALGAGWSAFDFGSLAGIVGLLASPGKSVFLYAPVVGLGLLGLVPLARRRPREATLVAWAVTAHVVFYGSYVIWHGDASWGPRFLLPVVGIALLPAGELLSGGGRGAWAGLAAAATLGLAVNLGAVLVTYAAYTVRSGGSTGDLSDRRRWEPRASPVLGQWRLFLERVGAWRTRPHAEVSLEGFWWPEGTDPALFPRWTREEASVVVPASSLPRRLEVEWLDARPPGAGPARLELLLDGAPAAPTMAYDPVTRRGGLALDLPAAGAPERRLTLRSATWSPARETGAPDERELGVWVERLEVREGGRTLRAADALVPRLPVTERTPWGKEAMAWFYETRGHVADVWWWHVWFSGLPRALVLLALLPLAVVVASGLRLGAELRGSRS